MKIVEQFKRRILDLAIRGKLVPQDPNDEPASVLLERIRAEKAKLVKEGKIKGDKNPSQIIIGSDGAAYEKFGSRFLSHAETQRRREGWRTSSRAVTGGPTSVSAVDVPFALPQGWAWARLEEISCTISGKRNQILAKEIKQTGKWAVVSQGQNLVDGYADLDEKVIRDVPIVLFGDHTRNVKYLDFPFVVGADGTKLIRSFVDAKWLYYWVLYASSKIMDRGYARHWNELIHLPVPLPPLSEQKRIVAKIEELFAVADSLGAAADGLENAAKRLDKKILDLAIRGKLVPQDPNDEPASELVKRIAASHRSPSKNQSEPIDPPFDIPDSWEWVRLGAICEILDSKRKPVTKSNRKPGPYPYYGATCIQDFVSDFIFDEPLVLLGEDGAKWGKGDKSAFCVDGKIWVNNHAHVLRPCDGINHIYLVCTLDILDLMPYVTGTTVPKLNQEKMCDIQIPLPPLAEQKRIVAKIEELRTVIKSLTT